jgi:hypothetical protein
MSRIWTVHLGITPTSWSNSVIPCTMILLLGNISPLPESSLSLFSTQPGIHHSRAPLVHSFSFPLHLFFGGRPLGRDECEKSIVLDVRNDLNN